MPIQKETACKGTALKNIKYITNPEKTVDENGKQWVATHNMLANGSESGAELHKEFREVNNLWKKNKDYDERKYYHVVINFKGVDGVTPEMAMNVGRAYLEHFYPNNQAVMAVHQDKDGVHFHACVNSVNMENGKKIDRSDKDLAERKDYVNEVAQQMYDIEPFNWRAAVEEKRAEEKAEDRTGKNNNFNYAEQQMHTDGRVSELDELRSRILKTALSTHSRQEFEERLQQEYGITMPRNTEKTVSFKYKEGDKGTIRGRTLGDYYTAEYIDRLIDYNRRQEQTRSYRPADRQRTNFNDLNAIAKDKNYIVARNVGFTMSSEEFQRASENELTCRYAFMLIRRQRNLEVQNGALIINGQKVQTDERLQKMYNATVAAAQVQRKHGCENMNDLEKKTTELEGNLAEIKTELRKERKIETALKNKLQRNENLYNAFKTVYQNTGTPEEINKAKRLLYRNGIKQEHFNDVSKIDEISRRVIECRQALSEQTEKTRELYFKQKDLQKDIENIEAVIAGVSLANNPKFYYGDDIEERLAIEAERIPEEEQTKNLSVDELISRATDRVGEPGKNKDAGKTRTYTPDYGKHE